MVARAKLLVLVLYSRMPKKVTQRAGWLKTQQAHMPRPLQNALSVAPAQAGAQPEAQLQLSGR